MTDGPEKAGRNRRKRRDGGGRFPKGVSGNPRGRPPRGLATVEKLRAALERDLPAIIETVVAQAKAGDLGASKLILERVLPPLKATEMPIPLSAIDGSMAQQGAAIVREMAAGVLSPSQATQLLGALGSLAKIVEVDDLARRLAKIEGTLEKDETWDSRNELPRLNDGRAN